MRSQSYPHEAGWKDSEVSKPNAERIEAKGRAEKLRHRVLQLYIDGFIGTADECASMLHEDILAIRPRCSELAKRGWLVRTAARRRSQGGGMAAVLKVKAIMLRPKP